jgi:hypothetical protein
VKKILLAAVFAAAFASVAIAQTGSSIPPRDPPFGKGNPDNETMHEPSSAGSAHSDNVESIPPRDPPFGKGNPDNDTMHQPSSAGSAHSDNAESIPSRDPPFGKGELRNEPTHLPSSVHTQGKAGADRSKGDVQKSAKSKDAHTMSAAKKDNPKGVAKPDSTPKTDTD